MVSLKVIEAEFLSAVMTKASAHQYDYGEPLTYLEVDYSKASDSVSVKFSDDDESSDITLRKAEYVTWLIPNVKSIANKNGETIEGLSILLDYANNALSITVELETDGTNE